jgi:hypothetical protein
MRNPCPITAAALVLSVSFGASPAWATDDCDAVLRPANETGTVLHRLQVGYLQLVTEQKYMEAQRGANAEIDLPIVKKLSTSFTREWNDFDARRDAYLKAEQYPHNEFETRSFARTFVSNTAIEAWLKCKAPSDSLLIVARRPTATRFTARAHWNPREGTPTRVTLQFTLSDGGSFEKERIVTTATRVLDRAGHASVTVYRKPGERPRVRVDSQTGYADEIVVEATGLQLTDGGRLTSIVDPAIRGGCRLFAEGQSIVFKTNAIPGTVGLVLTRGDAAPGFISEIPVGGAGIAISPPPLLRNGALVVSLGTTESTVVEFKEGSTTLPGCKQVDLAIWDVTVKIEPTHSTSASSKPKLGGAR